jgi:hypothetical protein
MTGAQVRSRHNQRLAILVILGLIILVALGIALARSFADDVRIVGQADWPFGFLDPKKPTPQLEVFRNYRDWNAASGFGGDLKSRWQSEKFFTDAFGTKAVNFDRQILLLLRGDPQWSRIDRLVATRVVIDKNRNTLTIYWALQPRPPGQPATYPGNSAATLVLLKRFDGDVMLNSVPDP